LEWWNNRCFNESRQIIPGFVWLAGFALMAQNAFGLGLAKDQVVPLNIGGKSARFEALLGNKVPAAILDPPYTTMAAKEGYKLLVGSGADGRALSAQYRRGFGEVFARRFAHRVAIRRGAG
jgi:hypothetical protein